MSGSFFDFRAKKIQNDAFLLILRVKVPIFCRRLTSFSKLFLCAILPLQVR